MNVKAINVTSLEDVTYGEDRYVKCPDCDTERHVEPDATYTYVCEGCEATVKVEDIMEDVL